MNPVGRLADLAVERDAWVAMNAAVFEVDAHRIDAVLDGSSSTASLPEPLAYRVVKRFAGDPDACVGVGGDDRPEVRDALDELADRAELAAADVAALVRRVAVAVEGRGSQRADVAAAVELERLARSGAVSTATLAAAIVAVVDGSVEVQGLELETVPERVTVTSSLVGTVAQSRSGAEAIRAIVSSPAELEPVTLCCVVAALARWTSRIREPASFPLGVLAAAVSFFSAYGHVELERDARSGIEIARQVGAWFLVSGGPLAGPGSLTAAFGASDPSDAAAELLGSVSLLGDPELVAETLSVVTHRGSVCCEVFDDVATCAASVDPAALMMALRPPSPGFSFSEMLRKVVGLLGSPERAEHFAEVGLEHRRVFLAELLQHLPGLGVRYAELPIPLVEASMRLGGLAAWLHTSDEVVEQVLAAGAGVGRDRWAVIAQLAAVFRGTPAELVSVSAELAPGVTA